MAAGLGVNPAANGLDGRDPPGALPLSIKKKPLESAGVVVGGAEIEPKDGGATDGCEMAVF